jgi:ribosomal protein S18 acetylase RimI-like enzyme
VLQIRYASEADFPSILALWVTAEAEETVTDDEEALRDLLRHAPQSLLIAELDDWVVGTLIVGWDGWRGSFYRLAVHPDWRRRAIGRQLVARGESQLDRRGARRIALFAVGSDPRAVPFWKAMGYEAQPDRQRLVKNLEGRP